MKLTEEIPKIVDLRMDVDTVIITFKQEDKTITLSFKSELIKEWREDAKLCEQLVKILSNHCGETGKNEGAVQTLNRIIEDVKFWNKRRKRYCELLQLEIRLKKRIEELKLKTREDRIEWVIEELQKITEGMNETGTMPIPYKTYKKGIDEYKKITEGKE